MDWDHGSSHLIRFIEPDHVEVGFKLLIEREIFAIKENIDLRIRVNSPPFAFDVDGGHWWVVSNLLSDIFKFLVFEFKCLS